MHIGVWRATVHGVGKSRSRLSDWATKSSPISIADDVWYLLFVFKAFQSPSKNFQIQRYFFFTYKPNQHEGVPSPSLSLLSPILQIWQWQTCLKSRWKSARGFELFGCFNWHAIFTEAEILFLVRKTTSIHQRVAAKVSSNLPGPVGRDCKRFYWKHVQSNRISIIWLLYLKELPCSIKHQREITF